MRQQMAIGSWRAQSLAALLSLRDWSSRGGLRLSHPRGWKWQCSSAMCPSRCLLHVVLVPADILSTGLISARYLRSDDGLVKFHLWTSPSSSSFSSLKRDQCSSSIIMIINLPVSFLRPTPLPLSCKNRNGRKSDYILPERLSYLRCLALASISALMQSLLPMVCYCLLFVLCCWLIFRGTQ